MPGMIRIDLERSEVHVDNSQSTETFALATSQAFDIISRAWLRCGWDCKHVYSFTWLGRPIVQLPEDMFRLQEVIYRVKPDVIIEVGVAHGGSLVFYAGLCKLMDRGRVIGIDIEIRPHNRAAIEAHELSSLIELIEGNSIDSEVKDRVRKHVHADETVMVLLDGCHQRDHVRAELEAYGPLVTVGSYIIAMDGIMQDVAGAPRTSEDWAWNNPRQAALEFVRDHPEFVIEQPSFAFQEGVVANPATYWPGGYIRRVR